MATPFITLTIFSQNGYEARPVFLGTAHIKSVTPRLVRRTDGNGKPINGGAEAHEIVGSWITIGDDEEGTFPVTESYDAVTSAIRAAFA